MCENEEEYEIDYDLDTGKVITPANICSKCFKIFCDDCKNEKETFERTVKRVVMLR